MLFDGRIELRDDRRTVGTVERLMNTADRVARNENFRLEDAWTGRGRGRRAFVQTIDLYERLGIETVRVDAADVGRYVWATAGSEYEQEDDRRDVLDSLRTVAAALGFELKESTLRHPWHLAMLDEKVSVAEARKAESESLAHLSDLGAFADDADLPLGKALMLCGDCPPWRGVLRLDQRTDGYVRYAAYRDA